VVNGKDKRDIQVSISIPEGWNLSTAWVPVIGEENTFRVADLDELMESFLFAGTHRETKITRNGFTLKFILGGDAVLREESRYIEVASGVMDYYINLMGGAPRPGPGGELNQSLVIISQSADVDGEVIGNHLSMFMNPSGDPMSQMMGWFMFAHEFFHLWNGKTLRFTTANTDWFKEGVSNYYTIKALHQTGFVSEEEVLAILNNLFYQRYIHDPGFGSLPPSEAANGFDKDNHWGLIYGGGLFAGIAMDMEIRFKTGNRRSLDDLMREFYREYGGTDNTIGQETILTCANRLSAMDFGPFMEAHINGIEPLSLAPYLQRAGAIVDDSNKQLIISNKQDKTALQKAIWAGFLGENKAADKNK
jgi:predicted metalloprotease with PDZ domain